MGHLNIQNINLNFWKPEHGREIITLFLLWLSSVLIFSPPLTFLTGKILGLAIELPARELLQTSFFCRLY